MKKTLLFLIAVVQLTFAYSQEINYQKTFKEAKNLAAKEHKPIFVLINAPENPSHHLANYTSGISSPQVVELYNKKFISYKTTIDDSSAKAIGPIINSNFYPEYIFLDSKAQPIYKTTGNTVQIQKYLDMAQETLRRLASGKTLSYYEELDKSEKITYDQLKDYITLKESLDLFDNAALIDKYINFLTIKDLNDYDQILFILKAGPYAYGKTYNLIFTNKKIVDSIYKREPIEVRRAINNHIIANSRNEARKTKNAALAQNTAAYIRGTWSKNYAEGLRNSNKEMIAYYYAVKDTANYYRQAYYFYDGYLNISADSAKKLEKLTLERIKESLNDKVKREKSSGKSSQFDSIKQRPIIITSSTVATNSVANELNTAAWDFYLLGTHNINYLFKALLWCRRSIELQPVFNSYDTMAHVMYRLNFYDEATLNQQKAIDMAMATPNVAQKEIENLKTELSKIRERKL